MAKLWEKQKKRFAKYFHEWNSLLIVNSTYFQNGTLPFNRFEFLVSLSQLQFVCCFKIFYYIVCSSKVTWLFREISAPYLFLIAQINPAIQWRTKYFRCVNWYHITLHLFFYLQWFFPHVSHFQAQMGRNRRAIGEHSLSKDQEPPRSYRVVVEALKNTQRVYKAKSEQHQFEKESVAQVGLISWKQIWTSFL